MPRSSHSSRFYHPHNIVWGVYLIYIIHAVATSSTPFEARSITTPSSVHIESNLIALPYTYRYIYVRLTVHHELNVK
jgi:hypothetical protein